VYARREIHVGVQKIDGQLIHRGQQGVDEVGRKCVEKKGK